MIEQMVETKALNVARGLNKYRNCRLCGEHNETVENLVISCRMIANSEYLTQHNKAVTEMAAECAKEYKLIGRETKW